MIGHLIKLARIRAGFSARELSSRAGLSASYVTKLEAGEIEPSLRAFSRLAAALDLTTSEIVWCVRMEGSTPQTGQDGTLET